MKLERKKVLFNLALIICGLFVFVACSGKKEEAPVKQEVVTPVKKEEVKQEIVKPVNVISYGVQIGAYKMFDVEFTSDIKNIKKDGLSHYVLGSFTNEKEAKELLKIMIDLGIKDAFVVKMKDGKIIKE
ncbi:SPOR domain-containing protein [Wenyingzhuangia marina]|uniref:Sporulation related domain-containing protein n=1 Tax=Wenyingzhuangia marina TaxID=1195760 RepID=A0A1M5SH58_9FLAO|nr:hypothetical protein [Wenyingzhuangia marina]GGF62029.1 hypothetical protein GCM10011397_01420 [Wenyingzhuangia marina]SHH37233.1 hypothetical protein SAMN05444281_0281 [Wenyingzhuangia marina]